MTSLTIGAKAPFMKFNDADIYLANSLDSETAKVQKATLRKLVNLSPSRIINARFSELKAHLIQDGVHKFICVTKENKNNKSVLLRDLVLLNHAEARAKYDDVDTEEAWVISMEHLSTIVENNNIPPPPVKVEEKEEAEPTLIEETPKQFMMKNITVILSDEMLENLQWTRGKDHAYPLELVKAALKAADSVSSNNGKGIKKLGDLTEGTEYYFRIKTEKNPFYSDILNMWVVPHNFENETSKVITVVTAYFVPDSMLKFRWKCNSATSLTATKNQQLAIKWPPKK